MEPSNPSVVRFGVFEVDVAAGEVRKSGRPVRLQDQPFRILKSLLERPGEIVTREELRFEIWGDDVYVDFDRSLNTSVARLRESLGDSPTRPAYIETVPRKGYRFIARLDRGNAESAETSPESQSGPSRAPAPKSSPPWRRAAIPVALSLILLAVAAIWFGAVPPSRRQLKTVPLTSYPGVERSPTFSPDGTRVAFVWNGAGQDNYDIYAKVIGIDPPLPLTRNPNKEYSPVWSPDGRSIAFVRDETRATAAIYVVPALGGPERKLTSIHSPPRQAGSESLPARCLDWSRDGEWVVFADRSAPEKPFGLFALSIVTGERRKLLSPPEGIFGDLFPAFSQDGRSVAFVRWGSPAFGDLYVLALSRETGPEGDLRRLTFDEATAAAPVWAAEDREIIFWSSRDGGALRRVVAADNSQAAERLVLVGPNSQEPAIDSVRNRLAYTQVGAMETSIQLVDTDPEGGRGRLPVALVASTGLNINPDYSPDGNRIVFQSQRSGRGEIWICNRDGSDLRQLTSGIGTGTGSPRWSPDGELIAFDVRLEGNAEIYVVGPEGGPPRPSTKHRANDLVPNWSRDGEWLYFASDRSGEYQIWKMPREGGEALQVTHQGGLFASESPDGGQLYYSRSVGATSLWSVPTAGGEEAQVLESLLAYSDFVVLEKGIYFIPTPEPPENPTLHFWSFDTNAVEQVMSLPKPVHAGLAVSPDGRSLLYSQVDHESSDLMLMEGFR